MCLLSAGVSINSNIIALLKNKSVVGDIQMDNRVEYPTGKDPTGIAIADFDGDEKSDLIVASFHSDSISIYRNTIGEVTDIALCPPLANSSITANVFGITYQWQVDTGLGFNNIVNNIFYGGTNTQILQLINIPSAMAGVQIPMRFRAADKQSLPVEVCKYLDRLSK
ncbi:MAG: hypothetical protein ABIN94_08105 [Ferruginibacter sp.]